MAQILRILGADLDRTETWIRYDRAMCLDCVSSCCTLPVEARLSDLIRMGVVDEFEKGEPLKDIAKRLKKDGVVERLNAKTGLFTLVRLSNNDCVYLHPKTRLCTIYDQRPETCRNHPRVGPRPGYCAYKPQKLR
ncbi:YkgJ family cysteine cluster protein [Pseudomonas sp. MOIL14HWK12:I2]|uniref:YkgJ family cysteine cluster protein n=1 Tax=Pseudomonas sp. MOIL14HWK12:I2 TaxID=1033994 RepID=UPI00040A4FCE|nr:YkgJ family cysteine cluster protein [Pseudomonas sp. MOIL14HWK12:I2]